jgi:hypothetical protein
VARVGASSVLGHQPIERDLKMKLNTAKVEKTLSQFEAQAIPENHPAVPQLSDAFGEHTFFLDGNGLNIVEPAQPGGESAEAGQVVKVASWNDSGRTSLAPHEPVATDVIVRFD